ncbi:MAG: TlpA family protein disulfide reductase [Bacteroidales bacterium]|nr:TlpA family protein disulfide reductase [Bacteroidales bacterium]
MGYLRFLVFTLFLITSNLYSQVNIQVRVKQTFSKQARLFFYQKSDVRLVDSSAQVSQWVFKFSLPVGYKQGVYKFVLGKSISFDFIVADEPQISLETVVYAAEDSLKSLVSKENELFIKYQNLKKSNKQQLWHLNSLIDFYRDSSLFGKALAKEVYRIKTEIYLTYKRLVAENPNLFTSHLILLELKPLPTIDLSVVDNNRYLINNWWKDVNLKDTRLANTSEFELKMWEFVKLYFDDRFTREQQDSAFINASKTLMSLDADTCIKSNFRTNLFKNYIETDYDATTKYLFSNIFEGLPPMRLSPEEQTHYGTIGKNEIDSKAFDFKIKTFDEKDVKLSKINATYKLIVFWSMWCPHCTEMMPELYKTYQKFKIKGFEVAAICIDDEIDGWQKTVKEKGYGWINAIEPDKGKSKILSQYNVEGTPVMLLMDNSLKIISRPSNVKQLEAKLNQVLK